MTGKYRDEIDGLRAISVLAVILFHMGYEVFRGGFLGVDVFFVISGYLITGILVANPTNLKDFYIKRIRRIMPPMLMVVGVSLAFASYLFLNSHLFSVSKQAIAALLSLSNVYTLYASAGYWSEAAEQMLFLHLWSLSLEEQFYLLFPFVVLILRNRHGLLSKIVLLGMIISFIACVYFTAAHPSASFYLLPTRAWELLAGSYCAINFKRSYTKGISTGMSIIGILMVIGAIFFISESNFPGWKPIIPVVGTCLLLVGGLQRSNPLNALLSIAPAKWIGKLSYSLYLWHWPVIIFSKYLSDIYQVEHPTWPLIFIMFALASFSYYLVEKPMRFGKHWKLAISSAFILALTSSSYIYAKRDLHDEASGFKCTWDAMKYSCTPDLSKYIHFFQTHRKGVTLNYPLTPTSDLYTQGVTFRNSHGADTKPKIVVMGDSHAMMWGEVLKDISQKLGMDILFVCAESSPIIFNNHLFNAGPCTKDQKEEFDRTRLNVLHKMSSNDILIISNRFDVLIPHKQPDLEKFYRAIPNNVSNIVIISQPPLISFGDKNAPAVAQLIKDNRLSLDKVKISNKWIASNTNLKNQSIAKQCLVSSNICFFELFPMNNLKKNINFSDGEKVYYFDDNHLTTEGTYLFKDRLQELLTSILSDKNNN